MTVKENGAVDFGQLQHPPIQKVELEVIEKLQHLVQYSSNVDFRKWNEWSPKMREKNHNGAKFGSSNDFLQLSADPVDIHKDYSRGRRFGWVPGQCGVIGLDVDKFEGTREEALERLLNVPQIGNSYLMGCNTLKGLHVYLRAPDSSIQNCPATFELEGCSGEILYLKRQAVVYDPQGIAEAMDMIMDVKPIPESFILSLNKKKTTTKAFHTKETTSHYTSKGSQKFLDNIRNASERHPAVFDEGNGLSFLLSGGTMEELKEVCEELGMNKPPYTQRQLDRQLENMQHEYDAIQEQKEKEQQLALLTKEEATEQVKQNSTTQEEAYLYVMQQLKGKRTPKTREKTLNECKQTLLDAENPFTEKEINNILEQAKENDRQRILDMQSNESDGMSHIELSEKIEEIVELNGNNVKYYKNQQRWISKANGIWIEGDPDLDAVVESVNSEYGSVAQRSSSQIKQVKERCQYRRGLWFEGDLDENPYILGAPGGVGVNLKTGQMFDLENEREHYVSKQLANIPMSPQEFEKKWPMSKWKRCIDFWTEQQKGYPEYLQAVGGLCLVGECNHHTFFIVKGEGGTGKTKFTFILKDVCGEYGVKLDRAAFILNSGSERHPAHITRTAGKRMVFVDEMEGNLNINLLKDFVGGEEMEGAHKGKDPFSFKVQATIVMCSNDLPSIPRGGEQIKRRAKILPFENTVMPEIEEVNLVENLKQEYPLILQWMIQGYTNYISNNNKMPHCPTVEHAAADYIDTQDDFGRFIDEGIEETGEFKDTVGSSAIHKHYLDWCEQSKIKYPFGRKKFHNLMQLKFAYNRDARPRCYHGIKQKFEY